MTSDSHYLQKELYQNILTQSSFFDFLLDASLDGLWYWDLEKPENEWMNDKFWLTLGYDPSTKQHKPSEWQDIINKYDLAIAIENFKKHCEDPNHPYDQIVRYKHKNGKTVWIRCRGLAIRNENNKPIRMLGAHTDVTAIKKLEKGIEGKVRELLLKNQEIEKLNNKLRVEATTDYLTGFYNRRFWDVLVKQEIERTKRNKYDISFLIIDIDDFKNINDVYGHSIGDFVIKELSRIIKENKRGQDAGCRWGGDEFIVLLPDTDIEGAKILAKKIKSEIELTKLQYENKIINFTISIGLTTFVEGEGIDDCFKRCDSALYKSKNRGKNQISIV